MKLILFVLLKHDMALYILENLPKMEYLYDKLKIIRNIVKTTKAKIDYNKIKIEIEDDSPFEYDMYDMEIGFDYYKVLEFIFEHKSSAVKYMTDKLNFAEKVWECPIIKF